MEWIAAIGGLAFMGVCLVGGGRLLWLARRTRGLPECVLGAGLFLMGGVATPFGALAKAPLDLELETRIALYVLQLAIVGTGMSGFAIFNWRVFRPNESWARALATALIVAIPASLLSVPLTTGFERALHNEGWGVHLFGAVTLFILAWTAFESTRYASFLRRRAALGLAEPVVRDRVRLWAIAMAVATVLSAATNLSSALEVDLIASAAGAALIGNLGLVAATAIYLAFLPPAAYSRWVRARAGTGPG